MNDRNDNKALIQMILSMVIFGTIGIFRKYMDLPSDLIAMFRGLLGALVLFLVYVFTKRRPDAAAIRSDLTVLLLSGAAIGFNWILLFEAYNYTTVAVATACYYMAPIFVILASPLVLKEKLTGLKGALCLVAFLGVVCISGLLNGGTGGFKLKGVILGLGAACLYASVILMNRKIRKTESLDRTVVQLFTAGLVMVPYVLISGSLKGAALSGRNLVLLLIVCIVHTGMAYVLYFGSIRRLKTTVAAVFSFLDPVVAIILSALLLRERPGLFEIIGAVLILGACLLSEFAGEKKP